MVHLNFSALLISTRFVPPRIGAKHVARSRLLQALERADQSRLTIVTGGPGYGKTTLLAQWRSQRLKTGAEVGWLSLSPEDKDFTQFCAAFLAALQRVGVLVEFDFFSWNGQSGAAIDAAVTAIVEGAAELSRDVYFILDDYHYVEDPWSHKFIQKLLDYCPDNLHLLISSRGVPPLALSRLRMMGQIVEIDGVELPFDLAETRSFLDGNLPSVHVSVDELGVIYELTGGWPSCLQLVAAMLRNKPEMRGSLRDFLWRSSDLQAYLSEEIMAHLPDELAQFAETLSIFRRFCEPMVEAVTELPRAGELLKRLEDDNLLILRLESDDRLAWYRFHPLFGEYLATRLQHRGAEAVAELNRRASRWLGGNGFMAEALRHANLGKDSEYAVELVERAAPATWNLEYLRPVLQLLEQLPEAALVQHPKIFLLACLTIALTARQRRAETWLAKLRAADLHGYPQMAAHMALIEAVIAQHHDDTERAVDLLEPLADIEFDDDYMQAVMRSTLCTAYAASGRYAEVHNMLDSHPAGFVTGRNNDLSLIAESMRMLAFLLEGDVKEAVRTGKPVLERAVREHGARSAGANLYAVYLADAYYELDRIDDAREAVANRINAYQSSAPQHAARAGLCKARLDLIQEGAGHALEFLYQQTERLRSLRHDRGVAELLAEQVKVCLALGRADQAAGLSESLDGIAEAYRGRRGFLAEIPAIAALGRSRVLRSSHPERALQSLDEVREHSIAYGRGRLHVLSDLLASALLVDLQRAEEAAGRLNDALRRGMRLGLVRTLIDEGADVRRQILQLVREGGLDGATALYARDLLSRFPEQAGSDVQDREHGSDQPSLTRRETEILGLLAQAMSNKRIALALNLTLETVKWNLKNIFAKLKVTSRYDAIVWAREHDLIR